MSKAGVGDSQSQQQQARSESHWVIDPSEETFSFLT